MKAIILIGYRCSGKTSVGRKLAEKVKRPFYDTDALIIDRIGRTIKEWVEEKGWESFRQVEKALIRGISSWEPGVIALGGGALMDPENREIVKRNGLIVWLTADLETILARMKSDPDNENLRPPFSKGDRESEIQTTINQRWPLYKQMADLTVDTKGKTLEAVMGEIYAVTRIKGSDSTA